MSNQQHRNRRPLWLRVLDWAIGGFGVLVLTVATQSIPVTWFASAALVGALAFWLWRRDFPRGTTALLMGLTMVLGCTVALVRGYTVSTPDIPPDTPGQVIEYSVGEGVLFGDYYNLEDPTETRYVVFYPPNDDFGVELEIHFPAIKALNREWGISRASVTTTGALRGEFEPRTRDLNTNVNDDALLRETAPFIVVDLPITSAHRYEPINVKAEAVVQYLASGEEIVSEVFSREFSLFVGTPDDMLLRQQLNRTRGLRELMSGEGPAALWTTTALGAFMLFIGYRQGRNHHWRGVANLKREARRAMALTRVNPAWAAENANGGPVPNEGALVKRVTEGSAPHRAGLRTADIIIRVDETYTPHPRAVYRAFGFVRYIGPVEMMVWRYGEVFPLEVNFDAVLTPRKRRDDDFDPDGPIRPA